MMCPSFRQMIKSGECHNTLLTAGSPYENTRASTVLLMLSGRYISDFRTRKFDNSNQTGACRLCPSSPGSVPLPQAHPVLQALSSTSSCSAPPCSRPTGGQPSSGQSTWLPGPGYSRQWHSTARAPCSQWFSSC